MKNLGLVCLAVFFSLGTLHAQRNIVYTNDNVSPNTASAFTVNSDGSLTLIPGSPFLTGGNGNAGDVDPESITTATIGRKSFLYVGNGADSTISAFFINRNTGGIELVGPPFPAGNAFGRATYSLATSPNGSFLFATDEFDTTIHVFRISGATGALSEVPGSPFSTGAQTEGLKVTANGQFLLAGLKSTNSVGVFSISSTGALAPVPGSPFAASGEAAAVTVNCAGTFAFVSDAGSSSVDAYAMAVDGSLIPVAGSPFPSGGTSTINALTLTPNSNNLLTSDVFNSQVSSLAVAQDGSLQPVPGSPFAADDWVGSIATTRAGDFVYSSLFAIRCGGRLEDRNRWKPHAGSGPSILDWTTRLRSSGADRLPAGNMRCAIAQNCRGERAARVRSPRILLSLGLFL